MVSKRQVAMEQTILRAIATTTRLYIEYFPGLRLVEPYACGFSRKGDSLLYGYQVGGASESGTIPDWRTFRVDRAWSASLDSETFEIRDDYYRDNVNIYDIAACVLGLEDEGDQDDYQEGDERVDDQDAQPYKVEAAIGYHLRVNYPSRQVIVHAPTDNWQHVPHGTARGSYWVGPIKDREKVFETAEELADEHGFEIHHCRTCFHVAPEMTWRERRARASAARSDWMSGVSARSTRRGVSNARSAKGR